MSENTKQALVDLTTGEQKSTKKNSVSYSTLFIIIISIFIGVFATLFIIKTFDIKPESFTVAELITFLFGIALSAASIVLAIAAISLGKASEQIMINRSDASIKLQNEVFLQTTEALQRIESSTGVTEKRIEDIISGRAGAISDKIVTQILEDRGGGIKNKDELVKEIRKSVIQGLTTDGETKITQSPEEKESAMKKQIGRKEYIKFHDDVLLGLANVSNVKSLKIGNGSNRTSGEDLFDGIFKINGNLIAVSAFSADLSINGFNLDGMAVYIDLCLGQIAENKYSRIFLAYPSVPTEIEGINEILEMKGHTSKNEIISKITIIYDSVEKIIDNIISITGNN
jgi:hypothetical protein